MNRRRIDRHLVGAGQQQLANIVRRAHPATDGEGHEALLGGPRDHIEQGVAVLVRGGDIEERQLVGAGLIIELRLLHRVAGIDEIDEVHALYGAAVLDVETGDDTFG